MMMMMMMMVMIIISLFGQLGLQTFRQTAKIKLRADIR
jgi:hypothetical protein